MGQRDWSVDPRYSVESSLAAGSLQREIKINTSVASGNSLLLLARTNFCQTVFTSYTFFKKPHVPAGLKDAFLTLTTCTTKLNMAIKIYNKVKQKWVMQIIRASKDITAISASASACQRNKRFNDFWPGWSHRKIFPVPPFAWSDNPAIATQTKKK